MTDQAAIPVDEATPTTGPCEWCGASTSLKLEVEPARYGKDPLTGVRVMKRHAIEAWCCSPCQDRLVLVERREKADKTPKGIVIR